jgi:hypothetical protein
VPITTGGGAKLASEQAPPLIVSSYVSGTTLPYRSERFPVWRVPCREGEPLDYWRGLSSVWDEPFTLLVREHDVICDDGRIAELYESKWPLATVPYLLHWPSTHKPSPQYAQRHNPPANCRRENLYLGAPISEGVEWCEFSGLGLVKIAPECRVGALAESHWSHLDCAVSAAIVGRWRVLWPEVEHDHY